MTQWLIRRFVKNYEKTGEQEQNGSVSKSEIMRSGNASFDYLFHFSPVPMIRLYFHCKCYSLL